MGILISYVDINLTQVGTVPAADAGRPVVDKVLRESYLSAEYTFDPALGSIDVAVTNYREDPHGDHEHVLHFYSKNPVSYRDATAMEIELWRTYFWEAEKKLAKILNREFSGELPRDLLLGQVRIDTLDLERRVRRDMAPGCGCFRRSRTARCVPLRTDHAQRVHLPFDA